MSASLRYQVLLRDNSRCTRCGATPQTHGVSLHVDHIVPMSRGGKTELHNLQTLCEPAAWARATGTENPRTVSALLALHEKVATDALTDT
jgi:5-methylcytosine-specific restriction endonuclease McrA